MTVLRNILVLLCLSAQALAQTTPAQTHTAPLAYGPNVTLAQAKVLLESAQAEAIKNNWTLAIAIVDTGGNLVAFARMDNTQLGSIGIAMGKAKTANNFKRPTKALEDALAAGGNGLRILAETGMTALEGGEPIIFDGKVIGGIGASGMQSGQDAQVVKAALSSLH